MSDVEDWESDFDLAPGGGALRLTSDVEPDPVPPRESDAAASDADDDLSWANGDAATKEEENQSSLNSSTGGTIKGLMASFSGLSLASPSADSHPATPPSTASNPTPPFASSRRDSLIDEGDEPSTPRARKMTTLRLSSSLSALLASAANGPGKVTHLGSTPHGQATSVLGDWDEDLDLPDDLSLVRPLRAKSSFASHLSDDTEDEALLPPTPRTAMRKPTAAAKVSEKKLAPGEDDDDLESDFDLPSDLAQFTLSPLLNRPSMTSLASSTSRSRQPSPQPSPSSSLQPPTTFIQSASPPGSSIGGDTSAEDDDLDFFDEIVLPPFLGGPGAMTPPSDGDSGFFSSESGKGGKIDLQAVLKQKLEARGEEDRKRSEKKETITSALDVFRDRDTDGKGEEGLEIEDGVSLPERMRTRSMALPTQTAGRKERTRTLSSAIPIRRQPSVLPPLPRPSAGSAIIRSAASSSSTMSSAGSPPPRPSPPRRSQSSVSHAPSNSTSSRLGRPSSASTALSSGARSSSTASLNRKTSSSNLVSAGRPNSAQASHRESLGGAARKPAGPPPAPSAASRDRVKLPTVSVGSSSLSSVPPSPSLASTPFRSNNSPATPALRSKKSQATLATPKTIERKRSLQNLSSLDLSSSNANFSSTPASTSALATRRALRSPVPSSPVPSTPTLSSQSSRRAPTTPISKPSGFAKPTAASSARVRDRVISGGLGSRPSPSSLSQTFNTAGSRPGSAAGGGAKGRTSLDGLVIPLVFSKPRKGKTYGDGTELDAFDDLPTNKEREKQLVGGAVGASPRKTKPHLGRRDGSDRSVTTMKSVGQGKRIKSGASDKTVTGLSPPSMSGEKSRKGKKETGQKKEPQLIRNLGSSVAKVQGEMTWNPTLQKWEGNESVLRDFDKVLATSTRPALITQLSTNSPARLGIGITTTTTMPPLAQSPDELKPSSTHLNTVAPVSRTSIKVVGSMAFDPVRMSWYSINSEEEDELDLFGLPDSGGAGGGDVADDEADEEGEWGRGEEARMLKNRASFVFSETGSEVTDGGEERARMLWRESEEAEERSREELRPWRVWLEEGENDPYGRKGLFDLRTLIMDTRAPPRN